MAEKSLYLGISTLYYHETLSSEILRNLYPHDLPAVIVSKPFIRLYRHHTQDNRWSFHSGSYRRMGQQRK